MALEHAQIWNDGILVGKVTSGCPSPSLKQNIAIGYVQSGSHKVGTKLQVVVRGKNMEAVVVKMPFVPHNYYRME